MALVAFLRGVNVGGHRAFRPSQVAREMSRYGMVNIGAAGTFVIHRPMTQAKLRAELVKRLPFATQIMICDGREILALETTNPYRQAPKGADITRFVSIMAKRRRLAPATPIQLPPAGKWLLKILATDKRFAFGVYRRHMKVIGYLGMLDKLLGTPVTTRNWNTISSVIKVLQDSA